MNPLNNSKQENIKIWENTQWLFGKEGPLYQIPHNKSIPIYQLDWTPDKNPNGQDQLRQYKPNIEIVNDDSITYAKTLLNQGLNPLVLNMASHVYPGGGVKQGSRAQEEDLFRRSNYHKTLNKFSLPKGVYPLKGKTVIYSHNVCIIKDKYYQMLESPFYLSFIACPAIRNPKLIYDNKINPDHPLYQKPEDKELMRQKIEMLYVAGIILGYDSLVLGALGCGAFNNPTQEVAKIFKEFNQKYGTYYKKIGFPVLSMGNDKKYQIFKEFLEF